jgi:[NiFe] hydrogenase assembly HybE family chaperone
MRNLDHACARLLDGYRAVAAGDMSALPGFNAELTLEAVGFREWEGHGLGVLIAPWFMNLILLPGPDDDWAEIDPREGCEWKLPTELIVFHPCDLAGPGLHLTAPLFTDLSAFPDQDTARAVAREVMRQLFEPGAEQAPADSGATRLLERPVSRRGLFRFVASAGEASGDA